MLVCPNEIYYNKRKDLAGMKIHVPALMFVIVLAMSFSSCYNTKELAYVSDAERDSAQVILNSYTSSIHPRDQLYVYVSS